MKKKNDQKKKYEALREELIAYIKDNNLKHNDHLPTVRDIIATSGYSYATVNRTLIEMEKEGIIFKHQGKGLFVERIPNELSDKQFALIIPLDVNPHKIFMDILEGVKEILEKEAISLLISISNMSHEEEKKTIERFSSKNVDGMIIFLEDNYTNDYSHLVALKNRKVPFVLIDRFVPELETDYVVINNRDAMLRVCRFLKEKKKCDKIIFIPPNDGSIAASPSVEKLIGYKNAIHVLYGSDQCKVMMIEELLSNITDLSKKNKNLGICFNHDSMVLDLYKMLSDANIELPSNCHIFGYNNNYNPPQFPTVEQFNKKVGMKAAEILIEKIKNPNSQPAHIYIEPKLVIPDGSGSFVLEKE